MPLIDLVLLKSRLADLAGRFDVDALDACDSTSSELMRRADRGAPSGTVVVADRQSAGRGRRGRSWLSDPESSLTFSLLWRFAGPPARLSGLSLAVGVALARALERLGARDIHLKWPNDILWTGGSEAAKVAGILVELSSDRRGTQAIIGIGINLVAPTGDLPQPAAGLLQSRIATSERHEVLATLLRDLAVVLDGFSQEGFALFKDEWGRRHAWQDRPVQLLADGASPLPGICRGVDNDGALLLDTGSRVEHIFSGDVSLRPA